MRVHSSHSSTPIEIKGHWHVRGPQDTGDSNHGNAPAWLDKVFEDKEVVAVAIERKNGGVVYARMEKS